MFMPVNEAFLAAFLDLIVTTKYGKGGSTKRNCVVRPIFGPSWEQVPYGDGNVCVSRKRTVGQREL